MGKVSQGLQPRMARKVSGNGSVEYHPMTPRLPAVYKWATMVGYGLTREGRSWMSGQLPPQASGNPVKSDRKQP